MSIFCSTFSIGDEHKPRCARMKKLRRKVYQQDDSKPCTCGSSPLVYQGSHVLPKVGDKRGGSLDLAVIPGYIRCEGPELPYFPYLRVGIWAGKDNTVLLTREHAAALRDELTTWLKLSNPKLKGQPHGR